jgi:hypothetical protein
MQKTLFFLLFCCLSANIGLTQTDSTHLKKAIYSDWDRDRSISVVLKYPFFHRVVQPPVVDTIERKILVREGYKRAKTVGLDFLRHTMNIMTAAPNLRIEYSGPIYDTIAKTVNIKVCNGQVLETQTYTAYERSKTCIMKEIEIPAEYRTIMVHTLNPKDIQKMNESEGEWVPDEYLTIKEVVVLKPAEIKLQLVSAEFIYFERKPCN